MTQSLIFQKLHDAFSAGKPGIIKFDEKGKLVGHCFGCAVTHSAMNITGYREWWHSALIATAKDPLETKVTLAGARNKEETTVGQVADRALNYLVINHTRTDERGFEIQGMDFLSLLEPNGFFEVIDANGKIRKIHERVKIAGYFTKEQLMELFDPSMIADTICLIHCVHHSINTHNDDLSWYIYDPNYDHTSKDTIIKHCATKDELISEITRIQGHSLCFEIATLDANKILAFPAYKKLMEKEAANLLKEEGLHLIATHTPHQLEAILDAAEKSKEGLENIAAACSKRNKYHPQSGLDVIAIHLPTTLPKFIACLSKSKEGPIALAKAIESKNELNSTGLDVVAASAPQTLPAIIECLKECKEGPDSLGKAIVAKNKTNETGFQIIVRRAPAVLPQVIDCLNINQESKACLATVIASTSAECWTELKKAAQSSPKVLSDLTSSISHNPKITQDPSRIAELIALQKKAQIDASSTMMNIFSEGVKQSNFQQTLKLAEEMKQALTNHDSPYRELCKQSGCVCSDYGPSTLWKLMLAALKNQMINIMKLGHRPLAADESARALAIMHIQTSRGLFGTSDVNQFITACKQEVKESKPIVRQAFT